MKHIDPFTLQLLYRAINGKLCFRKNNAEVLHNDQGIYFLPGNNVAQHNLVMPYLEWIEANPGKIIEAYTVNPNDRRSAEYRVYDYSSMIMCIHDMNMATGNSLKVQQRVRKKRADAMQCMFNALLDEYQERDGEAKTEHVTEALEVVAEAAGVSVAHAARHMDTTSHMKEARAQVRAAKRQARAEERKAALAMRKPETTYLLAAIQRARVSAYHKNIPVDFKTEDVLHNAGITDIEDPATYPTHCPLTQIRIRYSKDNRGDDSFWGAGPSPVHFGYPLNAARVWRLRKGIGLDSGNITVVSHAAYIILDGEKVSADSKKAIARYVRENSQ